MSKKTSPAASTVPAAAKTVQGKTLGRRIVENWQLYALLLILVIITVIYKYIPMYGIQIAFRDYKAAKGLFGSK